jgi:hypothetical protein
VCDRILTNFVLLEAILTYIKLTTKVREPLHIQKTDSSQTSEVALALGASLGASLGVSPGVSLGVSLGGSLGAALGAALRPSLGAELVGELVSVTPYSMLVIAIIYMQYMGNGVPHSHK